MPSNIHPALSWRDASLDLYNGLLGANPRCRIYDGTQPATANTALGAQVLLADIPLDTDPFAPSSAGTITMDLLPDEDASADASGTATWASITTSAGVRILDVSAGAAASTPDLVISPSAVLTAGGIVRLVSFSKTLAA